MLTPNIKLRIASNLLSLNDNNLILASGIIADIKNNENKRDVYKLINEQEDKENFFIGGEDNNMISINTTNPLKKKAIDRVLNISDDKLEEVINIIELLKDPQLTNKDIMVIKHLVGGYLSQKQKSK